MPPGSSHLYLKCTLAVSKKHVCAALTVLATPIARTIASIISESASHWKGVAGVTFSTQTIIYWPITHGEISEISAEENPVFWRLPSTRVHPSPFKPQPPEIHFVGSIIKHSWMQHTGLKVGNKGVELSVGSKGSSSWQNSAILHKRRLIVEIRDARTPNTRELQFHDRN
jgi:hypothetical protein